MKVKLSIVKIIVPLALVAIALTFAMPQSARFSYEYKIGSEWQYSDLYSNISFPLLKTDSQLVDEQLSAASAVVPYFRYDDAQSNEILRNVASANLGENGTELLALVQRILSKGIVQDEYKSALKESEVVYIQKNKRASRCPSAEIWTLSTARSRLFADALQISANSDSLLRANGIYEMIVPNLVFDRKATELANQDNNSVSPTSGYISNGTLLVRAGEIVTPEIAQLLDSYKVEKENRGLLESGAVLILGNFIISLVIVALLFFAIFFSNQTVFNDSRYFHIITVFLLFAIGTLIAIRQGGHIFLLVPYTLAALYLQAFFKEKLIIPVYTVCLLPLLLFADNGACWFIMYFIAGVVATCSIKRFEKGWMQFIVAIITFATLSLVYLAMVLLHFLDSSQWGEMLVHLFAASLFAVAGYPLIYLFEKMFNLVSNSRLREICDTSNSILRILEQKTPGTFQHSLQVMNMADAAARAIDANPLLVRAGALYHDIGKIRNPQCFVENESLTAKAETEKYHYGISPQQSAADIIKHVTDGVDIAKKERLPQVIKDFIITHHGTSMVSYFYNKAINEGGHPDESEFRYPGKKPRTKEQVILMLCDSIEAASRSLSQYSPEACSAFVEKIVKSKLDEGQLDSADISVRELQELKDALKTYLAQMHHERIAYPEKRNKKHKDHESRKENN